MTVKEFFTRYYSLISSGELESLDHLFQKNSPYLDGIKRQYESLHRQHDITASIEHIELVAKQDDLLVVRDAIKFEVSDKETTKKSHLSNLHHLTKSDNDQWKIHSTLTLSVEQE
jgi:hypothetical protein